MTNKERLIANNAKIEEIQKTLARKQVSPVDMLQARVDETNSCEYLFYSYGGKNLDFISGLDTSKVTDMGSMFYNCYSLTSLDLSNFDTSNVTDMSVMFRGCSMLTNLDLSNFDTSKVTRVIQMFYGCASLTDVNLLNFDTSKVSQFSMVFYQCSKLKNIIGVLDMVATTNTSDIVADCKNLETITLKNIKRNITLGSGTSYGTKLTNETLINTIQQLWDYSSGTTTYKLTLSTTSKENIANIYVKLITPTEGQIAEDPNIIYKKPCVVCESTDVGAMTLTEYATSKGWAIA